MPKKEKELLLRDLCCRLPYGIKCDYHGELWKVGHIYSEGGSNDLKPYLRPMKMMTEKEKEIVLKLVTLV